MIANLLIDLKQQQFTGVLHVQAEAANHSSEWKIYFCLGKLIWAEGGRHSYRAWRRHILKYCSQVDLGQVSPRGVEECECPQYYILTTLLQRKLVQKEPIAQLISSQITDVFFDILQQEALEPLKLEHKEVSASSLLQYGLKMSVAMLEIEQVFPQAEKLWSMWQQSNLTSYSPNNAPRVKNKEKLQQEVPAVVYQNFVRLLDGKRTLRDLAIEMNKDVFKLAASLLPYVNKGLVELIEVPDIEISLTNVNSPSSSKTQKSAAANRPLIACVDDSPQVCRIMEQIIIRADYRFLGIQQPIQAVPTLIAANPSLIFLDIGMPVLNGYELCSQIRRVSKLKDIPVVFLTGNDGIVDRVKAKVVGASDFVAKPVEVEKIIKTIEKFSGSQAATVSISG